MVPFVLASSIDTVSERLKAYKDVRNFLPTINHTKIVSYLDVRAAFYDTTKRSPQALEDVPYGIVGKHYAPGHHLRTVFSPNACETMQEFPLPATLMKEQTRIEYDAVHRQKGNQLAKQQADIKSLSRIFPSLADVPGVEQAPPPSHIECYYLGDFMDRFKHQLFFDALTRVSAALGDAPKMLNILKALRDTPDYSDHFPERPPRKGKTLEKLVDHPGFMPPILQPIA